ncbi:DUF1684 domain-containing protein [Ohtaekwangia koreensis]|uniref:DUF1684 domain-containing protein n=1 Tax=Ohtaekwangia koreensis TaxID=688867 RepID=A0A1T5LTB6_9BACT|nr:DUF1684 domain-containing protein [Ohtaekwangia koreensis]SKC79075.1 hypothetical protein SAMN05660236_3866 [Ohtaekwangia koreensis]
MKKKNIFILVIIVVVMISLLYSFLGSQDQTAYIKEIEQEREEKDQFMRTSKESPFANKKETFQGLKYYPIDIRYKVTADLTAIPNKKVVLLSTSDGKEQQYVEYAYAEFDLNGYHNKLLILEMIDTGPFRGKLFLAFGDETSAGETYGAGRYLDVEKVQGSNTITLDFNMAYNPYCAYAEEFSCPFPPPENLLKVAIRAGEKVYHN